MGVVGQVAEMLDRVQDGVGGDGDTGVRRLSGLIRVIISK